MHRLCPEVHPPAECFIVYLGRAGSEERALAEEVELDPAVGGVRQLMAVEPLLGPPRRFRVGVVRYRRRPRPGLVDAEALDRAHAVGAGLTRRAHGLGALPCRNCGGSVQTADGDLRP